MSDEDGDGPILLMIDYGHEGWRIVATANHANDLLLRLGEAYGAPWMIVERLDLVLTQRERESALVERT